LFAKLRGDKRKSNKTSEICEFPGVGRVIYIEALVGLIKGDFDSPDDFPEWLKLMQSKLAEWLRGAPKRKPQYFLDMANLESYELLPHARDARTSANWPHGSGANTPLAKVPAATPV